MDQKSPAAQDLLKEFWVVTMTSVYHLVAKGEYASTATKIALRRPTSLIPVGSDLGEGAFSMIGIGHSLFTYVPEKYGPMHPMTGYERDFTRINTRYWGNRSSGIVGLFETEKTALDCSGSGDLKICDPRWLDSTKRMLATIGEDHPSFFITHDPQLGLLESQNRN